MRDKVTVLYYVPVQFIVIDNTKHFAVKCYPFHRVLRNKSICNQECASSFYRAYLGNLCSLKSVKLHEIRELVYMINL